MGFKYQDKTLDGYPLEEAFKRLEDHGADVVGINCFRDPNRMLPFLRRARSAVSCHLAAQPVAYRCTDQRPYFQIQRYNDEPAFPLNLDPFVLTRSEMADFAAQARDAGINYIGGCCGTAPHHLRAMAETLGIAAPNSRWSPHMELHPIMGGDEHIREKDERILCEQRFGAAHCHFMRKSGEGQD
jgi:betaine-homocysteine S-methyltransferase